MTYKVRLDIFEGPLDLLLYLIKKNNVNIYDIPIADITRQYLEYLEFMKLLDLNIAGEFLVMAATLMQIKSKMLLPPDETEEEEAEEEDPRQELVKRLLEYQRFKDAAAELAGKEAGQKDVFKRVSAIIPETEDGEQYFEASLFELITAFTKVVKTVPKKAFYEVIKDEFTVSEKIHDIYHMLVDCPRINFTDLFAKAKNKLEMITIFLALLELIRLKEVLVVQKKHFDVIEIVRNPKEMKPSS
jgi:segregation and condensation protein A